MKAPSMHLPERLVNRFRRSPQERIAILFVVIAFVFFWVTVVGLDIAVHTINSVTVVKP
jgi:hypothetical protein